MRSAAGLATLAAGAILTFAVTARVPGIDLRIAGVIIMVAAAAWLAGVSPWAAAWARGVASRSAPAPAAPEAAEEPDFLLQDPAVLAADLLRNAGLGMDQPWLTPDAPDGYRDPSRFGRG
jgi:hypothetical protein